MKTLIPIVILLFYGISAKSQLIKAERILQGHEYTVLCIDVDKSGKYIVSGSYDTNVILWDYIKGKALKKFNGHKTGIWSVKFSPDGNYIASGSWDNNINAVGSSRNCLNILDSKSLKIIKSLSIYPDKFKTFAFIPELDNYVSNGIQNVSFNDESNEIAALSRSGDLFVWDINNNFDRRQYNFRDTKHKLLALSPDWKYLACCDKKGTMADSSFYLLELGGNDIWIRFNKPSRAVFNVYFSNDKYVASISGDRIKQNEIDLWSIESQKLLFTLKGHSKVIRSIAFSKDEKYLASAGEDNLINLWNILTGELIISFTENNEKEIISVVFSTDEKFLITGSQDKTIKYWKIRMSE